MTASLQMLPLVLLWPILIAAAYSDLRFLRIPDVFVLAALALFVASAPLIGLHEAAHRLAVGGVIFVVCLALFAANLLGGGDVKMGSALALFVPSGALGLFGLGFSLALLAMCFLTTALQRRPASAQSDWSVARERGKLPVGAAFALAGVGLPLASLF